MRKEDLKPGTRVFVNTAGVHKKYDYKIGTIEDYFPERDIVYINYQWFDIFGNPTTFETVGFCYPEVWNMISPESDLLGHKHPTIVGQAAKVEKVEEWRLWRNDQPGICPCGISTQMCTYHKG